MAKTFVGFLTRLDVCGLRLALMGTDGIRNDVAHRGFFAAAKGVFKLRIVEYQSPAPGVVLVTSGGRLRCREATPRRMGVSFRDVSTRPS
jgi:hypothetical protein